MGKWGKHASLAGNTFTYTARIIDADRVRKQNNDI